MFAWLSASLKATCSTMDHLRFCTWLHLGSVLDHSRLVSFTKIIPLFQGQSIQRKRTKWFETLPKQVIYFFLVRGGADYMSVGGQFALGINRSVQVWGIFETNFWSVLVGIARCLDLSRSCFQVYRFDGGNQRCCAV